TDVHEIIQRSHYPKNKQEEAGIFELENRVALCREHHADVGQHAQAEFMFRYLLYARYGYPRPSS
ncbi:MAG: hypothetical protein WC822_06780, partial [Candidatus Paceibacterota bacterium]